MKAKATAKFVGTSTRKVGLVAGLIRGRQVTDAQHILQHSAKRAATPVSKVLDSAIANAAANHNMKKKELMVESVLVGPGPTLKRFMPRARGAAGPIKHRMSHITIILADDRIQAPGAPKQTTETPAPTAEGKGQKATNAQRSAPSSKKEAK